MKASSRAPLAIDTLDARVFDPLCLTIALVLAVHAPHLPVWLTMMLAALLGLRWWLRRRRPAAVPAWLKLPLLAALTASVIADYGTLFGREPGSALAVGLLVLKLLECETPRDVRVSVSFACFGLMAALLFDQGLIATIVVALGLLPSLATLRALEPARIRRRLASELLSGALLLGVSLPLAAFAFLLVPRLDAPLWGAPNAAQARSGLGDSMSPGDFVELLIDDRPALRVSFDGAPPAPEQRYFRAYVLWHYDGRGWHRGTRARGETDAAVQESDAGAPPATIAYRIDLESTDQRVLPALDVPVRIPADAHLDREREVLRDQPVRERLSYRMQSALQYRLEPTLDEAIRQRALQLPRGFNPRTLVLGQTWRQRHGADDEAIAQDALALFHDGGFRYSLAAPPLGREAMDDFLFGTHEGFCEHYASAFTTLMRAAGVPARVVVGYQGGFWNRMGAYLLVRRSDAHAWSEIWLAGRGWVRIDPTAAVRPERVSLGAAAAAGDQLGWSHADWLEGLRNRWDIVNRWWNQGVVGFDAMRQRGLLTPFGIRDADTHTLGLLLAIVSAVGAAVGLAWALWRRAPHDPVLAAWRRLERRLARRGLARRHGEGPEHYLRRAARALPAQRQEIETLMRCYLTLRYAHAEPPPELARRFHRAARDFRPRRVVK
jgi:transglutaminase-like putative cysteine protease